MTDDEIYSLLRQGLAERQSASSPASAPQQPQSISGIDETRELSFDEILQKIQREIADG